MTSAQTSDFSKGSVPSNILRLAIPMTVAQLINVLYSVVDRMYIGHIPNAAAHALTGVGLTFPIISIVTAFANLFGMGGAPLCSIARGRGDLQRARRIMGCAFSLLLLLGGVFILREAFLPVQAVGVGLLLTGLLLFFNTRLGLLWGGDSDFSFGMLLGSSAALVWATYGLAQKVLLRHLTPTRILRVIYPCCALGLAPLATPADILRVDAVQLVCLIFACINTLVAYGSFTKAMSIWHAAKVSAVVATTPLFSLVLESLLHSLWPSAYPLDSVGLLSLLGACVVVLGALGIAVGPMLHLPHLPHLPRRHRR